MGKRGRRRSVASAQDDIPQSREFSDIRRIVEAIADGVTTTTDIAERARIRNRRVLYAFVTARAFGLLKKEGKLHGVRPLGLSLLATAADSAAELEVFAKAIRNSAIVRSIAPNLLDHEPKQEDLTAAIVRVSGLAPATAEHRAGAFLAWRRQLLEPQQKLSLSAEIQSPSKAATKREDERPIVNQDSDEPIHDKEIARIRKKVATNQFQQLLRTVTIDGLRGFRDCRIDFNFPVVVLVGENGSGKTTILKALACAYEQARKGVKSFSPAHFFVSTQWEKVEGVKFSFAMRHGNDERKVSINKRSERWRGIEDRPKRHIFLFDISRTMPVDALVGYAQIAKKSVKHTSEELDLELRSKLSWVMARSYRGARFAVSARKKRVGILNQEFGAYSKFHQGAGEAASLDLLGALEHVPDNSLVLIDEIEASLHPKAQRRLMQTLLWLCRKKNLQVIVTTHSQYILEELPSEARILLIKGKGDTKIFYGASTEFCLTSVDDRAHPELVVFVEDKEAATLVRELIARGDTGDAGSLLSKVEMLPAGASNVVVTLDSFGRTQALRFPCMGVVDADCEERGCVRLPGTQAPERQVFTDLAKAGWPNVAERLGVPAGDLHADLDEAMLIPNHHEWCTHVGNKIRVSRTRVWESLAAVWANQCIAQQTADDFVQAIKDRM